MRAFAPQRRTTDISENTILASNDNFTHAPDPSTGHAADETRSRPLPGSPMENPMLYDKMTAAMETRNAEAWADLLHEDYVFVRHQSGSTMNKPQVMEMMRQFMASEKVQESQRRCLYENDKVLVIHSVMDYADDSREAVLVFHDKKDGLLIRTETGATRLER